MGIIAEICILFVAVYDIVVILTEGEGDNLLLSVSRRVGS